MILLSAIALWLIMFVVIVGAVSSLNPVGGIVLAGLIVAKTYQDLKNK